MVDKPWSFPELKKLAEERAKGRRFIDMAEEFGRSRNALTCAHYNYTHRQILFKWEEIKKIVRKEIK